MATDWIDDVRRMVVTFERDHRVVVSAKEREVAASFEIGCFHALLSFYAKSCSIQPQNLGSGNEYRYLTSPTGNPANFSFVSLTHPSEQFELRQQVRIRSHLHTDIAFTPDLVVIPANCSVQVLRDADYAGGKRAFFSIDSGAVIAAHECKSMNPFPELLVSFIGMLVAAHAWLDSAADRPFLSVDGLHLAPSLFVGGTARALHWRMAKALEATYPLNIILGLHSGTWDLLGGRRLNRLPTSLSAAGGSAPAQSAESFDEHEAGDTDDLGEASLDIPTSTGCSEDLV